MHGAVAGWYPPRFDPRADRRVSDQAAEGYEVASLLPGEAWGAERGEARERVGGRRPRGYAGCS